MRLFKRTSCESEGYWERVCKKAGVNPEGVFIGVRHKSAGLVFSFSGDYKWYAGYFDEIPLILEKKMEDYL